MINKRKHSRIKWLAEYLMWFTFTKSRKLYEQLDRRPIFTIGQVWTDFVKRLPVVYPRYKPDPDKQRQAFMSLGLGMAQATPEQLATIQQQQYAMQQYYRSLNHGLGGIFG